MNLECHEVNTNKCGEFSLKHTHTYTYMYPEPNLCHRTPTSLSCNRLLVSAAAQERGLVAQRLPALAANFPHIFVGIRKGGCSICAFKLETFSHRHVAGRKSCF